MKILKSMPLDNLIFLDIETVRIVDKLEENTPLYDSWEYKLRYSRETEKFEDKSLIDLFSDKAALYSEFAKIVCITIGRVNGEKLMLKSYAYNDEAELLNEFCKTMEGLGAKYKNLAFAGHAVKGFDIPFIIRRCIVNQIELPTILDIAHLKPWDINTIDTMELWKAGGFYGASLLNISTALGLPSPKSDISGSETSNVYYQEENGLTRIKEYCERDVLTVANIVMRMRYEKFLLEPSISQVVKVEKVPILTKAYNTKSLNDKEKEILTEAVGELSKPEQKIAKDIIASLNL